MLPHSQTTGWGSGDMRECRRLPSSGSWVCFVASSRCLPSWCASAQYPPVGSRLLDCPGIQPSCGSAPALPWWHLPPPVFCCLFVALDQNFCRAPQPKPVQPVWTDPIPSLCCRLAMAFWTSAGAFHLRPVRTGTFVLLTRWSVESFSSSTRCAFSCLYPRLMDFKGSSIMFHPKRPASEKQRGKPIHFLM